jgi:hypothetical protein
MTGDCHVRFCESQGLQRPWPLAKKASKARRARKARKTGNRHSNGRNA